MIKKEKIVTCAQINQYGQSFSGKNKYRQLHSPHPSTPCSHLFHVVRQRHIAMRLIASSCRHYRKNDTHDIYNNEQRKTYYQQRTFLTP